MDKILIVSAKLPNDTTDLDGGTSTVRQFLQDLSEAYIIDYLFYDVFEICPVSVPKEINKLFVKNGTDLNYIDGTEIDCENKFISRVKKADLISRDIATLIDSYKLCIVIHCSMSMKLQDYLNNKQLEKIILLPMFLTPSYVLSGDTVPEEYTKQEKKILDVVNCIITPSYMEFEQLKEVYNVCENKIHIIPRSIGEFCGNIKKIKNKACVNICYIAAFRRQKNIMDSIRCIEKISKRTIHCHLYIVGPIHQQVIYDECIKYILENNLSDYITIMNSITSSNLKELYQKMDIAISTSNCETFGRSIFEGMAMGIPTIVFERLTAVKGMLKDNKGIYFSKDVEDMVRMINEIVENDLLYNTMSKSALEVATEFSEERQKRLLIQLLKNVINETEND